MLQINNSRIRELLLQGNFGLEKESLRITADGHLSQVSHPFSANDKRIVRDFCENQTEINTSIHKTAEGVMDELKQINKRIVKSLMQMPDTELFWPFSNPPYIKNEEDIPVAQFFGEQKSKTTYRNVLSDKYGRYKMTFSGIHFNYSFSGDLLRANYEVETGEKVMKGHESEDYRRYVDSLYLDLAHRTMEYGWLIVALTAASPIIDSSFFRYGEKGKSLCLGMSSVRCSELGYWNYFVPILGYGDVKAYADSIQQYVDGGLINGPSELYYPVRLKSHGENSLDTLRREGVSHIELRCIDLNPLSSEGIDVRDVRFAQMMLVWLATMPHGEFHDKDQVLAVQNYKSAAHFDLRTCKITMPEGRVMQADEAAKSILLSMRKFFHELYAEDDPQLYREQEALLDFQLAKIEAPENNNYAWIVRERYKENFVEKGIETARKTAESILKE